MAFLLSGVHAVADDTISVEPTDTTKVVRKKLRAKNNTNGLTADKLLPQFANLAPEAASLGRYGAFQVSEYSGSADISIPLYEVKSGEVSFPISLYYDASGIKVEQDATFVGLGWNLNYGGMISHIVCGHDDFREYPNTDKTYFKEYFTAVPDDAPLQYYYRYGTHMQYVSDGGDWTMCLPADAKQYLLHTDMAQGLYVPDIFQANFCGHHLSFIIDQRDSSKIVILGDDTKKYKIEYEMDNVYPRSFKIVDDKGITYLFTAYKEFDRKDAYYLTHVYGADGMYGKSHVQFDYITKLYNPERSRSNVNAIESRGKYLEGEYVNDPLLLSQVDELLGTKLSYTNRSETNACNKVYPKKITTGLNTIEFSFQEREDMIDTYAINGFRVKSIDGTVLDSISFAYDYYKEIPSYSDYTNKRLRLKSLNINSQRYQFSYNSSTLPSNSRSSSIDYWGYYNAANNMSKDYLCGTPKYSLKNDTIKPANYLGEANRYASEDSCKIGMLKRLTYPTGGYTDYEFEANRFNDNYYYPDASHKISFSPSTYTINDRTVTVYGTKKETVNFVASKESYNLKVRGYLNDTPENLTIIVKNTSRNYDLLNKSYSKTKEFFDDSIPLSLTKGDTYTLIVNLTANQSSSSSTVAQCWLNHDSINTDVKALPITKNENGGYSIGGGLRIKTIKNYDSDNVFLNGVKYEYEGGKLLSPTVQLERHYIQFSYTTSGGQNAIVSFSFDYANSEPSYYYACSLGNPATVGYSKVFKKEINGNGECQRKTEFEYHNYEYEMNNIATHLLYNSFFYCPKGYLNGKIKRKTLYTGNNVIQQSIDYSYDKKRESSVLFPKCIPTFFPNLSWGNVNFDFAFLRKNFYWTYLTKMNETSYDINGNKTISRVTTYSYDDSNYQISQETVSDGQNTEKVRYWYPLNSGNQSTGLSFLINKNFLSEVTGVETYKNNVFTGGSKFNYTTYNNLDAPVVQTLYSILPNSSRENILEMEVTGYDNYGNIREYKKKNGTPVTILWSYNHQYPVMEIVGKRYNDIKSTDVEAMENSTNLPTETRIRSVHSTISKNNPDAHVTAYIYSPWHSISRIISPNGYEKNYGYDSFGRLIRVGDDSGVLLKYQYNYKNK